MSEFLCGEKIHTISDVQKQMWIDRKNYCTTHNKNCDECMIKLQCGEMHDKLWPPKRTSEFE